MMLPWHIGLLVMAAASPAPGSADPATSVGLFARLTSLSDGPTLLAGEGPGSWLRLAQCYEAYYCVTPWGECDLGELLCVGEPCYCPTFNGPVWGIACDDDGCLP